MSPPIRLGQPRFIPALAGNIQVSAKTVLMKTVHPRARGEHHHDRGSRRPDTGSSPRSRGTCLQPPARPDESRFIPALAGNMPRFHRRPQPQSVHPRARGEHAKKISSPLAQIRFIPALAGNIRPASPRRTRRSVHPRARGEHPFASCLHNGKDGSSPRSRGTSWKSQSVHSSGRFIPALAGNI